MEFHDKIVMKISEISKMAWHIEMSWHLKCHGICQKKNVMAFRKMSWDLRKKCHVISSKNVMGFAKKMSWDFMKKCHWILF